MTRKISPLINREFHSFIFNIVDRKNELFMFISKTPILKTLIANKSMRME